MVQKYLEYHYKPVFCPIEVEVPHLENMSKLIDHRQIALQIAKHLIANGYIKSTEVLRSLNKDTYRFSFVLHAYKTERELP